MVVVPAHVMEDAILIEQGEITHALGGLGRWRHQWQRNHAGQKQSFASEYLHHRHLLFCLSIELYWSY